MNGRSQLLLLQFAITLSIFTAAQIQFPDDRIYPESQGTASAPIYIPKREQAVSDLTAIVADSPSYQQSTEAAIARGFSQMILDINRVVPTTSPYLAQASNVVYGPITVAGALAMVLLASVGQTFDEIANFLGLTALSIRNDPIRVQEQIGQLFAGLESRTGLEIGQRVKFATAVFVQQDFPIRPAFQQACKAFYGSDIMNLDFRGHPEMAQRVINTWVSGRTNSKIPTLLADPPPPDTRAIIASVFYFKAAWEFPFFDGHTKWRPFYVNGRKHPSDRMAEMMSNGGEFPYYKDPSLGVEIIGFPYRGRKTTMYVILPNESNLEKLRRLENLLAPADIDHLVSSTKYTEAVVLFPKMKLESTIDLRPALERLGVTSMFNPRLANLVLLSPGINQRFNGADAPFVSPPLTTPSNPNVIHRNTPPPSYQLPEEDEDRLIFTRFGDQSNCIQVLDPLTNRTRCYRAANGEMGGKIVRAMPLSLRSSATPAETLENVRQELTRNAGFTNPGLYADQVIHKVYIDITESGTEAASATGISLNRSGGRVTFRADIPFLFFIYHEESKIILFWGSVKSPTPSVATNDST